jgi:hypothetical protein
MAYKMAGKKDWQKNYVTIRTRKETHNILLITLAKEIGKRGIVISLIDWTEKVIAAGLKDLKYDK